MQPQKSPNARYWLWTREAPIQTRASVDEELLRLGGWAKLYLTAERKKADCWTDIEKYLVEQFYTARTTPPQGLAILGAVGVGKTSLMALIARTLCASFSNPMYFIPCGRLFDMYFERRFDEVNKLMTSTALFIDDVGSGHHSDFPIAKFENFIEHRYSNLLPTFITSNISIDDMKQRPGFERIADRLNDPVWMKILVHGGQTRRVRA